MSSSLFPCPTLLKKSKRTKKMISTRVFRWCHRRHHFFFLVENWILFISRYHTEVNIKGKCPLCAVQWWEKFLNFNTYPPVFLVIEKKRSSTELSPIRYVFKDASSSLYYLSRFIYIYFFFLLLFLRNIKPLEKMVNEKPLWICQLFFFFFSKK